MNWKILLFAGLIFYNFAPAGTQIARALASMMVKVFAPVKDPTLYYNAEELTCSYGYPVQKHTVESEDGYILGLHRIPYGRKNVESNRVKRGIKRFHYKPGPEFKNCDNGSSVQTSNRPPVLVQHGFFVSSECWLLQGPPYDLGTLLADAGYDVWLSNARGNYYSRKHRSLDPSDPKFWDFSFHEMGYYDLPALIDYILKVTNHDKLYYIGHSMGTTMFFIMASTRPEYNDKIRLYSAMTPFAGLNPAFFSREKRILADSLPKFIKGFEKAGIHEGFPKVNWLPLIAHGFCRKGSPFQDLCYDILTSVTGKQSKLLLRKTLHRIIAHAPSGVSMKSARHFVQLMKSGKFRPYDYGRKGNLQIYGDKSPPPYDIRLVSCPVSLYYSTGDLFVEYRDVENYFSLLPNLVHTQKLNDYNHIDYALAYTAYRVVYSDIISQMDKH